MKNSSIRRIAAAFLSLLAVAITAKSFLQGRLPVQAAQAGNSDIISRMDHVVVFSDSREKVDFLMRIFSKDFALPVFWGPRELNALKSSKLHQVRGYSGGIFLGNATLEFETWPGDSMGPRPGMDLGFAGLAFESSRLTRALTLMDDRKINRSRVEPWYVSLPGGNRSLMWNLVYLSGLNSRNFNLFICDYQPVPVNEKGKTVMRTHADMRLWLNRDLQKSGGGPLTVLGLKKVTLGITDLNARIDSFTRLLGAPEQGTCLFRLKDSQCIELISAEKDRIDSITLEVRSLEKAENYLMSRAMLGQVFRNRIAISRTSLYGLRIFLEQKEK